MIIVAFSDKTSKTLPRIFCRKWKHVSPIAAEKNGLVLYQFVRHGCVEKINIKMRDIKILNAHGWRFIYLPCALPHDFNPTTARTCVEMTKRAIGLSNRYIQTPGALFRHLSRFGQF